jgi:iron complex outermembrane receptor protein
MHKILLPALLAMFGLSTVPEAHAQHHDAEHDMEELIVTGSMSKKKSDTSMPVNLLSGEALRANAAATLGETLNSLAGVTSTSFGPGVGSPVIRGQSGNRVGVLQDGLGALDASTISQDHANSVEPLLAERIEVIRGPATLLYGNGAIGGVINIIDNRVPESIPAAFTGAAEFRHNTVADANVGVFKLDGGNGNFAWHLDGLRRERGNVGIPGHAIKEEPGHQEEEELTGFIENSQAASQSLTAGTSYIGERGFIGASISVFDNNYGIPPGAHEHLENGEEEEHEDANISIDMEQTRFNIKGSLQLDGFFESLKANVTFNDYAHREIESVDGVDEVGTVFSNAGAEARILLHHRAVGSVSGVLGLQAGDREFSAIGEESFIPSSDIGSFGLFAVESVDTGQWLYEFGLRLDRQTVAPGSNCDHNATTLSGSASAIWRFQENTNLLISLNKSERSATAEELFSNIQTDSCVESAAAELVPHVASGRIEIGHPGLTTETAHNLELALRKHLGEMRTELSLFYNRINDYIFLADTGVVVDETEISRYLQQDAKFSGLEAEISRPFELNGGGHMDLALFGDLVTAELDDGTNVPRIPPLRYGSEITWLQENWSIKLRATAVATQDKTALDETATAGHTLVDLYFDYHFPATVLFIKGNNLRDEEIRNHTSLIKHFAPEPGRGFEAGIRYRF